MFSRVFSGAVAGVDAYRVEVEVDYCGGIGQINIVGLPDAAVKESQERVRSAIKACDFIMPPGKKWIVNLAPADVRKEGPAFDLPIAVGVLSATGYVRSELLADIWMVGELGLDGTVRGTNGVLPVAMSARASGVSAVIVPEPNGKEAELIDGLNVYPVSHLKQVVELLSTGARTAQRSCARETYKRLRQAQTDSVDFSEVKGQYAAKRGMLVAAAGRHNILLVGPPGAGKSMLAQRLPGIMPPLEFEEALEVTKLYSVAGLLRTKGGIITERPFRAPHHSASISGLIGGGGWPRPGEISLSHFGVLFLDELTEFPRSHIDAFRQPLESGTVTISRAHQSLTYPAQVLLVGACNACPCGFRGDPVRECHCLPHQAQRYWSRLSGPFLDRIDLQIEVSRLNDRELSGKGEQLDSQTMKMMVARAVERQRARFAEGEPFVYNGQLSQRQLKRFCRISNATAEILAGIVSTAGLSARAYDRILRIARTIADLDDKDEISSQHIGEAIRLRNGAARATG